MRDTTIFSGRRVVRWMSIASLVAVGILAALWAHDRWLAPASFRSPPPMGEDFRFSHVYGRAPLATLPASGPLPMTVMEPPVALTPMNADVRDVPPPAGAKRLSALSRQVLGEAQQHARYRIQADLDALATYYKETLGRQKFTLTADRPGDAGRRTLRFIQGRTQVVIQLNAVDSEPGCVDISVVRIGRD